MSYFPKGHHAAEDEADDFDEYDATPYGGGYDIAMTYGRPLPPSEETCYPRTSSDSDQYDFDSPQYDSGCEPCAYADEALDGEYKSYARPKPRPGPPAYGGPPLPEPGYGGGGSEYGRRPEYGEPDPDYGSEYGRKPNYPEQGSEYGSGYGSRPEYKQPGSEYGSGYGRKPEPEYERPDSEYGSGYGGRSQYEQPATEYGARPEYQRPGSEYGSSYGRKPEAEEFGSGGYGRKSGYGEEESGGGGGYGYGRRAEGGEYREEVSSYGRTSYQSEYERPSYGRSEEEDYRKPRYEKRDDDEDEGYHRKKYGDDEEEDDDDEEKRRRRHHHQRKQYDD